MESAQRAAKEHLYLARAKGVGPARGKERARWVRKRAQAEPRRPRKRAEPANTRRPALASFRRSKNCQRRSQHPRRFSRAGGAPAAPRPWGSSPLATPTNKTHTHTPAAAACSSRSAPPACRRPAAPPAAARAGAARGPGRPPLLPGSHPPLGLWDRTGGRRPGCRGGGGGQRAGGGGWTQWGRTGGRHSGCGGGQGGRDGGIMELGECMLGQGDGDGEAMGPLGAQWSPAARSHREHPAARAPGNCLLARQHPTAVLLSSPPSPPLVRAGRRPIPVEQSRKQCRTPWGRTPSGAHRPPPSTPRPPVQQEALCGGRRPGAPRGGEAHAARADGGRALAARPRQLLRPRRPACAMVCESVTVSILVKQKEPWAKRPGRCLRALVSCCAPRPATL